MYNSCYHQNTNTCMNQNGIQPLIAPTRVCVQQMFTPIEQPVICPIEYRRINVPVVYHRFYPMYQHTCFNQNACCRQ